MKGLLLIARGLHLGFVGAYGNDWINTPALDRLAAEGVVFDQHLSDAPESAAARRAWRTGRYQFASCASPADSTDDLLTLLHQHHIASALITDDPAAILEGWEQVERAASPPRLLAAIDSVLNRLETRQDWLLCIELSTLLPPWVVPDEFLEHYLEPSAADDADEDAGEDAAEPGLLPLLDPAMGPLGSDDTMWARLRYTYAAAVSYVDSGWEALREKLDERGLIDQLFLIVTSDYSLPLGEHGMVGLHHSRLHEELIHLPLIIRLPGASEAGRRIAALTQSIDIMPTLLDAFGLPPPVVHGHNLFPLLRGEIEAVRPYACCGRERGTSMEWALRTPEWAFLLPERQLPDGPPRSAQLYTKPDDRWEVNNVVQHHMELSEHLEQVLRGFAEAVNRPGPLDPPTLRDVEAEPASAAETHTRAEGELT